MPYKSLNNLTVSILFLCLFVACKNKSHEAETPAKIEIPEDFVTFYNTFHEDSVFQKEHIIFPLEGLPALKPGTDISDTKYFWESDGWRVHHPFEDHGQYTRNFDNFAGIITETISEPSGQFDMVRRFSKMGNEWMLIYYKEMGPRLESSSEAK